MLPLTPTSLLFLPALFLLPTLFLLLHVELMLMLKRQLILIQCIAVLALNSLHITVILAVYSIDTLLIQMTQFWSEPW